MSDVRLTTVGELTYITNGIAILIPVAPAAIVPAPIRNGGNC